MNDQSFSSLGLAETILSAVERQGYETPTPIQTASIPALLAGRDLLGCAQTGTGKTAAFALPIIQLLTLAQPAKGAMAVRPAPRSCRALVVAPTRELAAQIDASFAAYGANSRITHTVVFGGVGKAPQVKALGRGVDVLVATPGRLLDLHSQGHVRLDAVEIVVLDEADRMLDMGFIRDVRRIMALIPKNRQTLLFSATMPNDISGLANSILRDPVRVFVTPEKPTIDLIDQKVAFVEKAEKRAFLAALINAQGDERAIVFTRTKHGADKLARALGVGGIPAEAIHANKSQNARTRTMDGFRAGNLRVLVATDLAARGIDVDGISHVYNYELPEVPETYVHRIGRTARAGASGCAIALCDREERPLLKAIEKLLRTSVPVASGPLFEKAAEEGRKTMVAEAAAARANPGLVDRDRDRYIDPRARTRTGRRPEGRPAAKRASLTSSSSRSIITDKESNHGTRFDRDSRGRPSAGGVPSRERSGGARFGQRSR
jgi:ATP-dependent RNA helicase RhlE